MLGTTTHYGFGRWALNEVPFAELDDILPDGTQNTTGYSLNKNWDDVDTQLWNIHEGLDMNLKVSKPASVSTYGAWAYDDSGAGKKTLTLEGYDSVYLFANSDYLATENFVNLAMQGGKRKDNCTVATTGNIALTGEQTIDGILTSTDRVMVWMQTDPKENGIYLSDAGAWSRAVDANTGAEILGALTKVLEGATYAGRQFNNGNSTVPTLGVDNITFIDIGSTTIHNSLLEIMGSAEGYHLPQSEYEDIVDLNAQIGDLLTTGNPTFQSVRTGGIDSASLNLQIEITETAIVFNDDYNDIDFWMYKDSAIASTWAFNYDAGDDSFGFNSIVDFENYLKLKTGISRPSLDAGYGQLYVDTDGHLKFLSPADFEYHLGEASPRSILDTVYDFLGNDSNNWGNGGSGNISVDENVQVDGLFGVTGLELTTSAVLGDAKRFSRESNNDGEILLGKGEYALDMIFQTDASVLPTGGAGINDYGFGIGLTNIQNDYTSISDGCYFLMEHNGANTTLYAVCENGGTQTKNDLGIAVAVDTAYSLKIVVNAGASSVAFYVDGVLEDTITTNIPATSTWLGLYTGIKALGNIVATSKWAYVDMFHEIYELTTVR